MRVRSACGHDPRRTALAGGQSAGKGRGEALVRLLLPNSQARRRVRQEPGPHGQDALPLRRPTHRRHDLRQHLRAGRAGAVRPKAAHQGRTPPVLLSLPAEFGLNAPLLGRCLGLENSHAGDERGRQVGVVPAGRACLWGQGQGQAHLAGQRVDLRGGDDRGQSASYGAGLPQG
eukprot:scaffold343_cov245-Pinguiococcus_pyrenoidosus.AAC.11